MRPLSLTTLSAALGGLLCLAAWVGLHEPSHAGAGDAPAVLTAASVPSAADRAPRLAGWNAAAIEPRGRASADAAPSVDRLRRERPTGRFGPVVPDEGATASVSGVLRHPGRPGERFVLRFDEGPDRGVEVDCDASGAYAVDGLHPGLAIVSLIGSEGSRCQRELLLRHRRPVGLSVDFGDLGAVSGLVRDEGGAPLVDAVVSLDGHETTTAADGAYRLARRASGEALLVVGAPGFASYCERLPEPGVGPFGARRPPPVSSDPDGVMALADRFDGDAGDTRVHVVLRPARTLEVRVPAVPGASGLADVLLVPSGAQRLSGLPPRPAYPWHRLAGLRVPLGGRVVIDDLPATRVDVVVSHPLARSRPSHAWTHAARSVSTLAMEPLPTLDGRVLQAGEPVVGARVALAFANPVAATQGALGPAGRAHASQPLPFPPQVVQRVVTDDAGHFRIGLDNRVRRDNERFLTVTAPSGDLVITREIEPGTDTITFDLATPGYGSP